MQSTTTLLLVFVVISSIPLRGGERPIVIAHRGASGYLPEHTLESVALAYGQGADFIEQDVVLSKDNQPIVLHDLHVDTVTDVALRFPGRARADGRYYAIDFTLDELRTLRVSERFDPETRKRVFAGRFPSGKSRFSIATLQEQIELIQGLNKSTGRRVGIYPEIKQPAWHRRQGYDISQVVLIVLRRYGFTSKDNAVFLQCFEDDELIRIRNELKCDLKLIQLISDRQMELITPGGLRKLATYADGIGPALNVVCNDQRQVSDLILRAHQNQLEVHPYTFRYDGLPAGFENYRDLLRVCIEAGVDGMFTDFPDKTVRYLNDVERHSAGLITNE